MFSRHSNANILKTIYFHYFIYLTQTSAESELHLAFKIQKYI